MNKIYSTPILKQKIESPKQISILNIIAYSKSLKAVSLNNTKSLINLN